MNERLIRLLRDDPRVKLEIRFNPDNRAYSARLSRGQDGDLDEKKVHYFLSAIEYDNCKVNLMDFWFDDLVARWNWEPLVVDKTIALLHSTPWIKSTIQLHNYKRDPPVIGRIHESNPTRIEIRDSVAVEEYESISDMIRSGWRID